MADARAYMRALQGTMLAGHQPPEGLAGLHAALLAAAGLAEPEADAAEAAPAGAVRVAGARPRDLLTHVCLTLP